MIALLLVCDGATHARRRPVASDTAQAESALVRGAGRWQMPSASQYFLGGPALLNEGKDFYLAIQQMTALRL